MKATTFVPLALVAAATLATARPAGAQTPACNNPAHRHGQGHGHHRTVGGILPDGPGDGWGFPNGAPDGYGWWDRGYLLPLGANRTDEYYFPRYNAVPPTQAFLPSYYNPIVTRGQRYLAYAGCGGEHPVGGFPMGSAVTPEHPYQDTIGTGPRVRIPAFTGRSEAPVIQPGSSGLTP
jgi:hypothetical protein